MSRSRFFVVSSQRILNRIAACLGLLCLLAWAGPASAQVPPASLKESVDRAVAKVNPALVRINVVDTDFSEGREIKYEISGSGAIIHEEGFVVTNHHVAGHAARIFCTLSTREEIEADLIGGDPLSDLAIIKLKGEAGRRFPIAEFGDSSLVRVGDTVLAMGSPMDLSQSVTLGIISNTEMIMPRWARRWGGIEQDGEDVGSLVKWIGHDAQIYGGNSGGPLVDINGYVIGINEIRMALGGAIPSNLAKGVAEQLIRNGKVVRAWVGMNVQPTFKFAADRRGVLVSGVIKDSPAAQAELKAGDIILAVNGSPVDIRFDEQLPDFNLMLANMPLGQPIAFQVLRDGQEVPIAITPIEREHVKPKQHEIKEWGITASDISFIRAKEMKRPNQDGVLVTSVRPGGPAGEAKPAINPDSIIVEVGGKPVKSLHDLFQFTRDLMEQGTEPQPVLTVFERKTEKFLTVVQVGIKETEDPGLEVKKAWLPVETQVLTRDIAELLGDPELKGFRITEIYPESTAEQAGLQTGDFILSVDDQPLTASAPEHYEELAALVRQYKVGTPVQLTILRNGERLQVPVELVRAPKLDREMKEFREKNFDMTVRDISFFDRAREQLKSDQQGVLVSEVKPGGWAALGQIEVGDVVLAVEGEAISDVETFGAAMEKIAEAKPNAVVFKVLRGIYTFFVELQPKWDVQE